MSHPTPYPHARPSPGHCYYWRFRGSMPYRFGYCSRVGDLVTTVGPDGRRTHSYEGLYRMTEYHDVTVGGVIVDHADIEWKAV